MLFISGDGDINVALADGYGFNLAIEMLFISGATDLFAWRYNGVVSISQSRCFSFQVSRQLVSLASARIVSISQSRCFSFQDKPELRLADFSFVFQSRNRDAFHFRTGGTSDSRGCGYDSFNLAIEMLFISGKPPASARVTRNVSISQSRCFSFQGCANVHGCLLPPGFNLVIEMLFISGAAPATPGVRGAEFQSRNRDAFHFRATRT